MVDLPNLVRPLRKDVEELLGREIPQRLGCQLKHVSEILALIQERADSDSDGPESLIAAIKEKMVEFDQRQKQDEEKVLQSVCQEIQTSNLESNDEQKRQKTSKESEYGLIIACSNFCKQLTSLSKQHYSQQIASYIQKQNPANLKDTLVFELFQQNIITLRNKISDYMLLLTTNNHQLETQSHLLIVQDSKVQKQCKSSARSLLTEKLKHVQLEYNQDDLMNSQQDGVIKGNWILKQMKTNIKVNQSVGVNNCNMSQPDYENFKEGEVSSRKKEMRRFQSHRIILGEINLQESERKERNIKEKESGCARCEIY